MRSIVIPLLLLASACQVQKARDRAPVTEAEALNAAQSAEAAYSSGDAANIAAYYAPRAVAFDAGHVDASNDPRVLAGWASEFVSMQPADFELSNRRIQITGPDSFVNSGVARFTVAAGQARPQVGVRMTQVYQRQEDGSWRIVHEHMSMPPKPAGQM
jgi:uncharacterized protein (TIGR02246 family)